MNELFESLVNDVYTITNRPDLVIETKYAVRAATTKAHNADELSPDIYIVNVVPIKNEDNGLYQIFTAEEPFVRFRKLLSLHTFPVTKEFNLISPSDLLDQYGYVKRDVYYMAGASANLRTDYSDPVRVTYLQKPDIAEDSYTSWIAVEYRDVIIASASAMLFDLLGKADEKNRFERLYAIGIMDVIANNIPGG